MTMQTNILVVDDSESIRELVSDALIFAGHNVLKGVNGEDGLKHLKQFKQQIHLIISDLNMPVMDGIEFVKKIREIPQYQYLPILILTTESQEDKRVEAKNAGATGWVVKPFDEAKLLQFVGKVLR